MDIKDLQQESSRRIVEKVIEALKFDEDRGVDITDKFVFCFEMDDDYLRAIINASPSMLLQLMDNFFETLQKKSPMTAHLAEDIFNRAFPQKKDAD